MSSTFTCVAATTSRSLVSIAFSLEISVESIAFSLEISVEKELKERKEVMDGRVVIFLASRSANICCCDCCVDDEGLF